MASSGQTGQKCPKPSKSMLILPWRSERTSNSCFELFWGPVAAPGGRISIELAKRARIHQNCSKQQFWCTSAQIDAYSPSGRPPGRLCLITRHVYPLYPPGYPPPSAVCMSGSVCSLLVHPGTGALCPNVSFEPGRVLSQRLFLATRARTDCLPVPWEPANARRQSWPSGQLCRGRPPVY